MIQLQEQERRHLARELHDEIGQCCVAIKVDAALIAQETHDKLSATCLQVLVESWSQRHKVSGTFTADGALDGLDEATNITLYRGVQESLSNIAQHARQRGHRMIRILLIDDHAVVRTGYRRFLERSQQVTVVIAFH